MDYSMPVQMNHQWSHRVVMSKRVHQTLRQKGWLLLRNPILQQECRKAFPHWWVGQRLQDWFLAARALQL
jgi:hypothetical protein